MSFRDIKPMELPLRERHQLLIGAIGPRPIAWVGTENKSGEPNLAPFSFFNAFSVNPPIVAISPSFRGRDGSPKDTLLNIKATGEFTISLVTYDLVDQVTISSGSFSPAVDEFAKAGVRPLRSRIIGPSGVAESPCVFECKLIEHVELGSAGGGGNLLLGEVVHIHIDEDVFDDNGNIDPARLDLVGRLGRRWYVRVNDGLFELENRIVTVPIGFDALPQSIRESDLLTARELTQLAGVTELPERGEKIKLLSEKYATVPDAEVHKAIQSALAAGDTVTAWSIIIATCDLPAEGR